MKNFKSPKLELLLLLLAREIAGDCEYFLLLEVGRIASMGSMEHLPPAAKSKKHSSVLSSL